MLLSTVTSLMGKAGEDTAYFLSRKKKKMGIFLIGYQALK